VALHAFDAGDAVVSYNSSSWSVTLTIEAVDPGHAVANAMELLGAAVQKSHMPTWPVIRFEAVAAGVLAAENEIPAIPPLVGVAETAQMLGVSKQRVSDLARDGRLPTPAYSLAAGPVWLASSVETFAENWDRRPGRRRKQSGDVVE